MDKIIKITGFFDVFAIVAYLLSRLWLELSSDLMLYLLSFVIGFTFFFLFILTSYLLKNLLNKERYVKIKGKKVKKEIKNGKFVYIFGFIFAFVIAIFSFNSSLYLQALVGNDLFLSIETQENNFDTVNGENISIAANFEIITNLFCSAECNFSLTDLSSGEILSQENSVFSVSSSISREYNVLINESVSGQNLYRIDFSCLSIKQTFCHVSSDNTKHASEIISVEHKFNNEQNKSVEYLREKIISLGRSYEDLKFGIEEINKTVQNISFINYSLLNESMTFLDSGLESSELHNITRLYNSQNFPEAEKKLEDENKSFRNFNNSFSKITESVKRSFDKYNNLVDKLYSLRSNIFLLSEKSVPEISLTNFIAKFNLGLELFEKSESLIEKEKIVDDLVFDWLNLSSLNETSEDNAQVIPFVKEINFSYITLNLKVSNSSFILNEPADICCVFNKCSQCLNENFSSVNYPVILLHGHSFNAGVSVLGSLEAFDLFQRNLEKEGFINAGRNILYLNYENKSGSILGKINNSVSIASSYYLDILKTDKGYSLFETKADNIDTYSIRLKDIIADVKYLTGKDKVIIVAHSMGGLVARRYLQVFGDSDVEKLVLISVPNHGVDGFVVSYCPILGTSKECDDMNSESLFMNKLIYGKTPSVPVYNIIGNGCEWENSVGDGIVKNQSAYLSFAENYYLNGTCNGFDYFHTTILDSQKYPDVYDLLVNILKENNTENAYSNL